ncbi:SARP family transcriptional regulator [Deinococcus sonorensis]|uniref:SARP family transcriptional regulator n=2 Tax=Deinococcus sonorensis TaxID=309891 RepID=A0AAU7U9G5_9DEIO
MDKSDLQVLFEAQAYDAVIAHAAISATTAADHAWNGIALLRTGRLKEAEGALHRAAILGHPEGTVEYGNLLRLLGRFDDACLHFQEIAEHIQDPELRLRLLRWWGVAQFQAGHPEEGLRRVERAWHGYVAHGDDQLTARVSQSLAQMHLLLGHTDRAKLLLQEAVRALALGTDPRPRLSALKILLDLQLSSGDLAQAQATLTEALALSSATDAQREHALLLGSAAELYRLSGEYEQYARTLVTVAQQAEDLGDFNLRVWSVARLADHQSLQGLHGQALETLLGFGQLPQDWPPELWATDGVLRRRRGDVHGGYDSLERAAGGFREAGRMPEMIRVHLHLASCALRLRRESVTVTLLQEALTQMLRLRQLFEFKPDLEELSELLQFAVLDPELSPLLEPLLDRLGHLTGQPRLPEDGAMQLQLSTLGRSAVFKDGTEISFAYLNTPLVLTYLALHPGRTRAQMQLDLFPERDAREAAGYVRQCIWDLRDKLGPEVISFEGPHKSPRYRLGRLVKVELDLQQFQQAIHTGELARALALYRGEFLPGVEEADWLLQMRDEARLTLTFELRNQMARYRSEGDQRRVVLLANQLLRADPLDVEVMQERVDAARTFAPAPELARYVAQLNRMLN